MGVYAQTSIVIICENNTIAKKVANKIKGKAKEDESDLNYQFDNFAINENEIYVSKSSERIQNLEYQCKELWKLIKDTDRVIEMNCPFMSEADGMFFENR